MGNDGAARPTKPAINRFIHSVVGLNLADQTGLARQPFHRPVARTAVSPIRYAIYTPGQLAGRTESFDSPSPVVASSAKSDDSSGGEESDVLKKLMQKREQELK